jgi:hypothetical protein
VDYKQVKAKREKEADACILENRKEKTWKRNTGDETKCSYSYPQQAL